MEEHSKLEELVASLKTQRDELRVKVELGKAEVKDEWDHIEKRWHEIDQKMGIVGKEAKAASKDVLAAVEVLGKEVAEAYRRIKTKL
ncbi:MAG: hypothetical protein IME93_06615 [Proteobacteria bacterium]|nr:hypothetical protein [Pseudomonadota bacterium]